jgi:hypothetical protein
MVRDGFARHETSRRLLVRHGIAVVDAAPGASLDELLRGRRRAA